MASHIINQPESVVYKYIENVKLMAHLSAVYQIMIKHKIILQKDIHLITDQLST